jgi:nucleoside-diphosphate-sugar epimerase
MKFVVTGAAGFIGAHLCRRLASDRHDVVAIDVKASPPALELPGVHSVKADIRDTGRCSAQLGGADAVVHLASVHLAVGAPDEEFRDVNVHASARLADAAGRAGVRRFIHVSTVGIYGHVAKPPANEDTERRPVNAYERTKLEGEQAVSELADRIGLDCRVVRPAWVFGPGCPRTAKLLRSVQRRRFFYVGRGSNLRHPVFVDDVVDALLLAAQVPAPSRRDYIVAGPRALPLRELVDTCADTLGAPRPRLRLPRPALVAAGRAAEMAGRLLSTEPPFSRRSLAFFENDNAFDIGAARRDLGFEPRVDFAEGIRRTLADRTWPITL